MNDIDFRDSLRRTFLVWSWVGILGALVATATSYSSQLYFTLSQGFRALDLRPNSSFMFTVYLLPSTCLILDWIIFYRYSGILYSVIILDVPGSDANQEAESRKTWHQLFVQFKYTLLYLILTWLLIMAVNSLPVLLALR